MQSAHQSILEYTYQFTLAESTQDRLNEICYTAFITITSTIITMGATWGINKAFNNLEASVYSNAAKDVYFKSGATSKTYAAISKLAQQTLRKSGTNVALNMFKVTCAVITETLEELYVDPMIEAYVTNKVADLGYDQTAQILLSGLAESGREQFLSTVTAFARAGTVGKAQVDTNIQSPATNIENAIDSKLEIAQAAQEAKAQQEIRQEYIKEGLSTILMFAGAMVGGLGGSIGTSIGNMMIVASVSAEGIEFIDDMFDILLKKSHLVAINTFSKIYGQILHDVSTKIEEGITPKTSTLSDDQKASFYHDKALAVVKERKRLLDMGINQRGATMYFLPDEGLNPSNRDYNKITEAQNEKEPNGPAYKGEGQEIWFRRDGRRLIDEIVDPNLDLRTKLGRETRNAIMSLMIRLEKERSYKLYRPDEYSKPVKDNLGREFVSFDASDFKAKLDSYNENPNEFGGVIYMVQVIGDFYVGLTEQKFEKRFEQHLLDSMRGYLASLEGIDSPYNTDFHKAITDVLVNVMNFDIKRFINEISYLSSRHQAEERNKLISNLIESMKDYIKGHIIEIHIGPRLLGTQEKKYIKYFPIEDLAKDGLIGNMGLFRESSFVYSHTDYLNLKLHGLNMQEGGSGGRRRSFPMYDIAIMIALGFSAPRIASILQNEYGLYEGVSSETIERAVQDKIANVLGGSYLSQEELLQPIINYLVEKGLDRRQIYQAFKNAEISKYGWFVDWSYSRVYLDYDISKLCEIFNLDPKSSWETIEPYLDKTERFPAGISESTWKKWIFDAIPIKKGKNSPNTIEDLSGVSERKIRNIIKLIAERVGVIEESDYLVRNLKYKLHQIEAKRLLLQGFIMIGDTQIKLSSKNFHFILCKHIFNTRKGSTTQSQSYFEDILFKGMTLNQIWARYHLQQNIL